MKISSPAENDKLKILVYGDPGAGKTVFGGSAQDHEETRQTLFLSAEGGTTSIRDRNIAVAEITDFDDFNKAHKFLHQHCKLREKGDDEKLLELHNAFHERDDEEPILYNSVVIDSLTEVQLYCMYDIMGVDYEVGFDEEVEQPQIKDWYQNSEKIGRLVRSFRNLPIHVIFTALKKEEQDERTGKLQRYPSLSGQTAEKVPGVVDIVGYMFAPEGEEEECRKALFQPRNGYVAKDRSDELPAVMKNPTVPKVFNSIYGG